MRYFIITYIQQRNFLYAIEQKPLHSDQKRNRRCLHKNTASSDHKYQSAAGSGSEEAQFESQELDDFYFFGAIKLDE